MYKLTIWPLLVRQGGLAVRPYGWAPRVLSYALRSGLTQKSNITPVSAFLARSQIERKLNSARIFAALTKSCSSAQNDAYPFMLDPQQKKDVLQQLKVFKEVVNPSPSGMVYILGWIGRTVKSDQIQKKALELDRDTYTKLLDSIQENIGALTVRELAVVVWTLGRMRDKHHPLVDACEEAILSHNLSTQNCKTITQVLMAFSILKMEGSRLFQQLEDSVTSGEVNLGRFDRRALSQILMSFAKTSSGSEELFHCFAEELLSREISCFQNNDLAQFVWSFSARGYTSAELFTKLEAELCRRISNDSTFKGIDLAMVLWAFAYLGQGSKLFFQQFARSILTKNIQRFKSDELSHIVWALGKAEITDELVFSFIENEVLQRGIHTFPRKDREMLLEGFKYAQLGKDLLNSL